MRKKATVRSKPKKADTNTQLTAAYVTEMAHELSKLARSAGYPRLSALLTLASVEVETSPPAVQRPQPTVK